MAGAHILASSARTQNIIIFVTIFKMKKNQTGFSISILLLAVLAVGLIAFVGWYVSQNSEPKVTGQSRDFSHAPGDNDEAESANDGSHTFTPEGVVGVSVRHDGSWTPEQPDEGFLQRAIVKTVGDRKYRIVLQKNKIEYLQEGSSYANNLALYRQVTIKDKPHYVTTSRIGDIQDAYISSCPPKPEEACSIKINGGYLLMSLTQEISRTEYRSGLDFSREDDKKVLEEFMEISKTLTY